MAIKSIVILEASVLIYGGSQFGLSNMDQVMREFLPERASLPTQINNADKLIKTFAETGLGEFGIYGLTDYEATVVPGYNPGNLPSSLNGLVFHATVLLAPLSRLRMMVDPTLPNESYSFLFRHASMREAADRLFGGDIQLARAFIQNVRDQNNLA